MGGAKTEFEQFQSTYAPSSVKFVTECVRFGKGNGPTDYQLDCLRLLDENDRLALRGPHGIGKTALASWTVLHNVLCFENVKVVTTASNWMQLTRYLWPEIGKWALSLKWEMIGRDPFTRYEMLKQSINRGTTAQAFAAASDNPANLEGAHAERMVYILDEAKSIPDPFWDAIEGAFAMGQPKLLAISTPGAAAGRFYAIHRKDKGFEDWETRHVTKDEAIAAGRMREDWAEQRLIQWTKNDPRYQNRILGNFATDDLSAVIPLSWVEAANDRWNRLRYWDDESEEEKWLFNMGPLDQLGVDVGLSENETVFAHRHGNVITDLYPVPGDAMNVTGKIVSTVSQLGHDKTTPVVDASSFSLGVGIVHRLRELKHKVGAFNAPEGTKRTDKTGEIEFQNTRAASWWMMRELLNPYNEDPIALPPNEFLIRELTTPRWKTTSTGKVIIESKVDLAQRLDGRSTDYADAVILAFWKMSLGVFFK